MTSVNIEATVARALGEAEATELRRVRSWDEVDLSGVLNGTYVRPEPTVGRRSDGRGLFYPGRCHTVAAETEAGKTWFALSACLDEINADHHVLYVDFEDDEGGLVSRLLTMGANRDDVRAAFHYIRPEDPLGTGINADDLRSLLTDWEPTLVILDGITEAMTLHGLNPSDNAEAARFGKMLPRRIAEAGPAVASLDHVTKDREGRGRYAIGAVHKLNGLNGAGYMLTNRTPFGVGITGRSTIHVTKDRPGQLRRHALASNTGLHWFGDLVMESHGDQFADVIIEPPTERDESFRPTVLMERISNALEQHGPMAQRKICDVVRGKATSIREALTFLQLDGHVSDETPHRLLKPYPGGDSE